jgi:hypothetical protein
MVSIDPHHNHNNQQIFAWMVRIDPLSKRPFSPTKALKGNNIEKTLKCSIHLELVCQVTLKTYASNIYTMNPEK